MLFIGWTSVFTYRIKKLKVSTKKKLKNIYKHKTSRFTQKREIRKNNKFDMENECLAVATEAYSLKATCPNF